MVITKLLLSHQGITNPFCTILGQVLGCFLRQLLGQCHPVRSQVVGCTSQFIFVSPRLFIQLGKLVIAQSFLGSSSPHGLTPTCAPAPNRPNHPNQILAHVLAHGLLLISYCPKDPHHILGHRLPYMPILVGYVLWCLGLTHGCLAHILLTRKMKIFSLGS